MHLKKFFSVAALLGCLIMVFTSCSQKNSDLTPVTLNEVAHSIFYAPMYVAIEKGYFADEGLDITLVNGSGADNVMTSLISGDADIGFMGPEATVYVYNQGAQNYAVNFAQLTQRAGNFLVARDKEPDFTWQDLKGKTVLGGRAGGMPEMIFEYVLTLNNIDPKTDLTIIQNVDFGLTAEAFASGTADYTVEFEPFATSLEMNDNGHVIASLGEDSGYVPYTCFSALESYIKTHPDIIQAFTNAIQKGLDYVGSHTPAEIADIIQPQFAETDNNKLIAIIDRYAAQDTWKEDCVFTEKSFTLLQNILDQAGELTKRIDYDTLITTEFAEKAVQE